MIWIFEVVKNGLFFAILKPFKVNIRLTYIEKHHHLKQEYQLYYLRILKIILEFCWPRFKNCESGNTLCKGLRIGTSRSLKGEEQKIFRRCTQALASVEISGEAVAGSSALEALSLKAWPG